MPSETRYVCLNRSNSLFLVEQPVDISIKQDTDSSVNHIWIYDRSGSMSSLLSDLVADLKTQLRSVRAGDTISIGWFSGEGQYRFVIKGFEVSKNQDFSKLDSILNVNATTIGCTCFSEILQDTNLVIDELSAVGPVFSLCFFTDGYPVVSNYSKELASIKKAISDISGKLASSLFVGYGRYYNKELMSEMSAQAGGFLIHADNLQSFSEELRVFLSDGHDLSPKQKVTLDYSPHANFAFSLGKRSINVYEPTSNEVDFSPSRKGGNAIYYLTSYPPKEAKKVCLAGEEAVGKRATSIDRAMLAAAYILTQRTKTDLALDVLAAVGDVALIDGVTNSFTNDEYGRTEAAIKRAVNYPKHRFTRGYVRDYLPPDNAFCLLDLIDILVSDEEAKFYPYHPQFSYNRIGVKSEAKPGQLVFTPQENAGSPLSTLTWNQSKLNLSILCNIPGTVNLPEEAEKLGFSRKYPCCIFRNYSLVKDGNLNIPQLPVSVSQNTLSLLKSFGVIYEIASDGVVFLDLTGLPVVNRKIARQSTKASEIAKAVIEECLLTASQKVYKEAIDELSKTVSPIGRPISPAQEAFLEASGIKRGVFSPSSVDADPVDFYFAKEFTISVKGFSSLPKLSDVRHKLTEGKKLTVSEKAISEAMEDLLAFSKMSPQARLSALEAGLQDVKNRLRKLRAGIQRAKFSVILGKTWFEEFTSREEAEIEIDGYLVKFAVREVKVGF